MTMTEDEWEATAPGRAYVTYRNFTETLGMVMLGGELGGLLTTGIEKIGKLLAQNPQLTNKPLPPKSAELLDRMDPNHQQSVRASLIVIAGWGLFEACVEDVAKATMSDNDSMLTGTKMAAAKIAQRYSVSDPADIQHEQWRTLKQQADSKLPACRQHEAMFALIGLDGPVPPFIEATFDEAWAIRNVWAHNAGVADHMFLRRAPNWAVNMNDVVHITREQAGFYLSAMIFYAFIILNRDRSKHGLSPVSVDGKPAGTPLGLAYNSFYTIDDKGGGVGK